MNRLQKKCLIAVGSTHLLAVVVLLCSGFHKPTPPNSEVAGNPAILLLNPQLEPEPARQLPQNNAVQTAPSSEKLPARDLTPVAPVVRSVTHHVEPNLTLHVRNLTPMPTAHNQEADPAAEDQAAADAARKLRAQQAEAFQTTVRNINFQASSSTEIDFPKDSTEAYADYALVVKNVYTQAWELPDKVADDEAKVKVSITIAKDGRVEEAHILKKSGDAAMDRSVQKALDRVRMIQPFPEGSTDKKRTYIINFDLKAKRMLG